VKEKIANIIKSTFELTDISDEISQKNCSKWDSLNHLNLIVALESAFNVSFEPEEIAVMKSLSDIEEILKTK
jgi:acyl carrier protein